MSDITATAISRGTGSAYASLKHYGKKGMRWGVRKSTSTSTSSTSEDAASARALLAKPARSVSNTDIQAALNRMRLESQFKELQTTLTPPSRTARATSFVKGLLGDIGAEQVNRVAKGAAAIAVENALQGKKTVKVGETIRPYTNKDFAKDVGKRIVPKKK